MAGASGGTTGERRVSMGVFSSEREEAVLSSVTLLAMSSTDWLGPAPGKRLHWTHRG